MSEIPQGMSAAAREQDARAHQAIVERAARGFTEDATGRTPSYYFSKVVKARKTRPAMTEDEAIALVHRQEPEAWPDEQYRDTLRLHATGRPESRYEYWQDEDGRYVLRAETGRRVDFGSVGDLPIGPADRDGRGINRPSETIGTGKRSWASDKSVGTSTRTAANRGGSIRSEDDVYPTKVDTINTAAGTRRLDDPDQEIADDADALMKQDPTLSVERAIKMARAAKPALATAWDKQGYGPSYIGDNA